MFLTMKRFAMDDVPLCLTTTKNEALVLIGADWVQDDSEFATQAQQNLMQCDIGSERCAYIVIEFVDGLPVNSQVLGG